MEKLRDRCKQWPAQAAERYDIYRRSACKSIPTPVQTFSRKLPVSRCLQQRLLRILHSPSPHETFYAHDVLARMPPCSFFSEPLCEAASLSALRFLFSSSDSLRSARIPICRFSTPVNQYPKLPPTPAKSGHTHNDFLLKNGRISMPSWRKRTARPIDGVVVSPGKRVVVQTCYVPKPLQNRIL